MNHVKALLCEPSKPATVAAARAQRLLAPSKTSTPLLKAALYTLKLLPKPLRSAQAAPLLPGLLASRCRMGGGDGGGGGEGGGDGGDGDGGAVNRLALAAVQA